MFAAAAVVARARAEIGTTENPAGSNRTEYGAAYGQNGVAWCGIFVWWVLRESGYDLRRHGFGAPASTNELDADARRAAGWRRVSPAEAQPGDVVVYDFGSLGRGEPADDADHVGIVSRAATGGALRAIEGNTSPTSSGSQANGGGVYERTRSLTLVRSVFRPPYQTAVAPSLIERIMTDPAEIQRLAAALAAELSKNPAFLGGLAGEVLSKNRSIAPGYVPALGERAKTPLELLQDSAAHSVLARRDLAQLRAELTKRGGVPTLDVETLRPLLTEAATAAAHDAVAGILGRLGDAIAGQS